MSHSASSVPIRRIGPGSAGLDGTHVGWHPAAHLLDRGAERDDGLVAVTARRDRVAHEASGVRVLTRDERMPGPADLLDPVDPERPPVVAVQVVRDEVPKSVRCDQPVGLGPSGSVLPLAGAVVKRDELVGLAGLGKAGQVCGGDRLHGAHQGYGRCPQRFDLALQSRGQEPVDPRQHRQCSALNARDGKSRRDTEEYRHGHGFVLVEQQRRHVSPDAQPVTACGPWGALNEVAQFADLLDVPADRPGVDPQPLGQVLAGPRGPTLQQGEEVQEPASGASHFTSLSGI